MEVGALLATPAVAVPAAGLRRASLSIHAPIPSKCPRFPSERRQLCSRRRSGRRVRSRALAIALEQVIPFPNISSILVLLIASVFFFFFFPNLKFNC